jgi:predicted membrane channel-forming protein YqfA (hemolysin III family)
MPNLVAIGANMTTTCLSSIDLLDMWTVFHVCWGVALSLVFNFTITSFISVIFELVENSRRGVGWVQRIELWFARQSPLFLMDYDFCGDSVRNSQMDNISIFIGFYIGIYLQTNVCKTRQQKKWLYVGTLVSFLVWTIVCCVWLLLYHRAND